MLLNGSLNFLKAFGCFFFYTTVCFQFLSSLMVFSAFGVKHKPRVNFVDFRFFTFYVYMIFYTVRKLSIGVKYALACFISRENLCIVKWINDNDWIEIKANEMIWNTHSFTSSFIHQSFKYNPVKYIYYHISLAQTHIFCARIFHSLIGYWLGSGSSAVELMANT